MMRIKKNTNEVNTCQRWKYGVGNRKSVFKGDDGFFVLE